MQHCSLSFLHGKRLHPCKRTLGVSCIVALLFERKNASAPVCRFPPGGRVSIPPACKNRTQGEEQQKKRGFPPRKQRPEDSKNIENKMIAGTPLCGDLSDTNGDPAKANGLCGERKAGDSRSFLPWRKTELCSRRLTTGQAERLAVRLHSYHRAESQTHFKNTILVVSELCSGGTQDGKQEKK